MDHGDWTPNSRGAYRASGIAISRVTKVITCQKYASHSAPLVASLIDKAIMSSPLLSLLFINIGWVMWPYKFHWLVQHLKLKFVFNSEYFTITLQKRRVFYTYTWTTNHDPPTGQHDFPERNDSYANWMNTYRIQPMLLFCQGCVTIWSSKI